MKNRMTAKQGKELRNYWCCVERDESTHKQCLCIKAGVLSAQESLQTQAYFYKSTLEDKKVKMKWGKDVDIIRVVQENHFGLPEGSSFLLGETDKKDIYLAFLKEVM